MDEKTKQKIKNIVNLVEKNNKLADELKGLDGYKNKLNKVKEHYDRVQETKPRKSANRKPARRKPRKK